MALFNRKKKNELDATQPLPQDTDTQVEADEELDRSVFNCDSCKGSGLIYHKPAKRHERCPKCNGTGKI